MPYQKLRRALSVRRPNRLWAIAPVIAVTICFSAICAFVLIDARHSTRERAGDTGASLATAIETDIVRSIESLNLSLQGVVEAMKRPDIEQISPELRQLVLFDRSVTAPQFGAILVLDSTGHLRFSSRQTHAAPIDLSDRDYFRSHLQETGPILHIGHPSTSKNSALIVGISRRLSKPDGSFAGVVAGTIQLDYFKKLFETIAAGRGSDVTLAHTDGTILMRWPFDEAMIGRSIKHTELLNHLARHRSGRFETSTSTDGISRLVAYSQISDLPIVIGVGQSVEEIYAQWRRSAWAIGLLVAALCVVTFLYSLQMWRNLKQRDMVERELTTLATTDGLTSVSNRGHFDNTIRREWRRARRTRSPIALLMIDADQFKAYNDRHGHQAGDNVLKAIGAAISGSIRRGSDLGARYGGDEFAVLLPETSIAGAVQIADQIRDRLAALREDHGAGDNAKISIGIACLVPSSSTAYTALLAAADDALYRAKELGRDRIELSDTSLTQPAGKLLEPQDRAA